MVTRYTPSSIRPYEMDESRLGEYVKYDDYKLIEDALQHQIDSSVLVGISEIADRCHTSKQAVSNWRARPLGFPKPIADLRSGPVFHWHQVQQWLIDYGYSKDDT